MRASTPPQRHPFAGAAFAVHLLSAGCADAVTTPPRTGIDAPADVTDATAWEEPTVDVPAPRDIPFNDRGCPTVGVPLPGDPCALADAACYGLRFMCFTATARGPAGLEQCRCVAGAWQCTNTCRDWEASLRDR